jgi:plastocyanin
MWTERVRSAAVIASFAFALPASAADVKGTVRVAAPPQPVPAHVLVDGHVCGVRDPVWSSILLIDEKGGVEGVVVHVVTEEEPPKPKAPAPPLVVDQVNCSFVPRVAAVPIGTEVRFRNSDALLHNVHAVKAKETIVNFSLPLRGQEIRAFVAADAGTIELRCEAGHAWMRADIRVFAHPFFAQTAAGGGFKIENLPKGTHRLVAWHPDLGTREQPFEIASDDAEVVLRVEF